MTAEIDALSQLLQADKAAREAAERNLYMLARDLQETRAMLANTQAVSADNLANVYRRLHRVIDADPRPTPDAHALSLNCRKRAELGLPLEPESLQMALGEIDQALEQIERQYRRALTGFELLAEPPNPHDVYALATVRVAAATARGLARIAGWVAPPTSRRRALMAFPLRFIRSVRQRGWAITVEDTLVRMRAKFGELKSYSFGAKAVTPAEQASGDPIEFDQWLARHSAPAMAAAADLVDSGPVISFILPVYRVPTPILERTLQSIFEQSYPKWQLCVTVSAGESPKNRALLDGLATRDGRIRLVVLERNLGISGNSDAAFAASDGDFIALIDHDDEIAPTALEAMARAIVDNPGVDFWYSDRDIVTEYGEQRIKPFFKPDWSPEMLLSVNYLTHLNIIRRRLIAEIGGWRSETDGAQDWDLFLRVSEKTQQIRRLPGIHYHWRMIRGSASTGVMAKPYVPLAQQRSVQEHLDRLGLPAVAELHGPSGFHIAWRIPDASVEVMVLDQNGLAKPERYRELAERLKVHHPRLKVALRGLSTNPLVTLKGQDLGAVTIAETLALALHRAVRASSADYIAILDAEVDAMSEDWLAELVGWLAHIPAIGFVSSLVHDERLRVVEAGRVVDGHNHAYPLMRGEPLVWFGMLGNPSWYRNIRAAGPHGVMFRRLELKAAIAATSARPGALGGGDAADFAQLFTDVCLETTDRQGRRGLLNPHAQLRLVQPLLEPVETADAQIGADPYFHPFFKRVAPLEFAQN